VKGPQPVWRSKILRALPYIGCAVPLALYQALYVNGFYPITEGWFSEYAHLIRSGLLPYRDFSLLLMPLYPVQLAGFQAIFGEGLFPLHVLGILVTCALGLALLDLLRNFFNPWTSAFAAAVGTIYYESGVAFLGYDFTQFLTLYLLLATVLLVRSIKPAAQGSGEIRELWLSGASGFFLACAVLIKQSNGGVAAAVLLLAGAVVATTLYRPRAALERIAALAGGFCLPLAALLAWLVATGSLHAFIADVFVSAYQAKGGLNMFAWAQYYFSPAFFVPTARQALLYLLALLGAMIALSMVFEALTAVERPPVRAGGRFDRTRLVAALRRIAGLSNEPVVRQALFASLIALGALCALIVVVGIGKCDGCWVYDWPGRIVRDSSIVWSVNFYVIGFAIGLVRLLISGRAGSARFFVVASLGVGLMFGNGTSAGLSEISTFLGVAILFAFLVERWLPYVLPALLPAAVALAFCLILIEKKFAAPYAWWFVATPAVRMTHCADAQGVLRGLCIPPRDYESIARIERAIEENSAPGEPIYVYPHMPIFYLMTNRRPFDNAVVSWFDFTSVQLADDLSRRLRMNPPSVIVMAEIPEVVIASHEHGFNGDRPLGQRKIIASIAALRASGAIRRVERIENLNSLTIDVYKRVKR